MEITENEIANTLQKEEEDKSLENERITLMATSAQPLMVNYCPCCSAVDLSSCSDLTVMTTEDRLRELKGIMKRRQDWMLIIDVSDAGTAHSVEMLIQLTRSH